MHGVSSTLISDEAVWQLAWTRHGVVAARASGELDVMYVRSLTQRRWRGADPADTS